MLEKGYRVCRQTIVRGGDQHMRNATRREFTSGLLTVAAGTWIGNRVVHASMRAPEHPSSERELLNQMKWLNQPATAQISGAKLRVKSLPKTDFWRKTFYGYVTDNGHFFHLAVGSDFVFEARVDGIYAALYDQAGLMVRIDSETWVKCGTEFFDNARHASVVFTREFSDWSTMNDLASSGPVWWRAVRKHDSLQTLCSIDGKNFTAVRMGYLVPALSADVGVMCAAPEGAGFDCVFDGLKLTTGGK
jgi:uncharacterized protein